MLYWGEDSDLSCCKIRSHPRFNRQKRGSSKHKKNVSYKKMYDFPITPHL